MLDTVLSRFRSPDARSPAAERLASLVFGPVWALLVVVAAVVLTVGPPPESLQWVPLVASAVVLGLPHGAVDHLALPRLYGQGLSRRWVGIVLGIYGLVGGAYALLWAVAPSVSFLLFVAITWLHWGQGDVYPLVALAGVDHLTTRPQRGLTVLVRGGFPMLVPLLSGPEQYRAVAEEIVGVVAADPSTTLDLLFAPTVRLVLGVGFGTLVVGTLALGWLRAGDRRGWLLDATEVCVLTVFFLSVPPILAVGLYFCVWHSLRHIARLLVLDGDAARALADGGWGPAAARFARDAAPLTAVSLLFLGGAYLLVPTAPSTVPELVALYLVLIAVLTLPHVVVVTWMDHEQGVFVRTDRAER